jgi:hypothetical protein
MKRLPQSITFFALLQVMKKSIPGVRIRRFIDFWGDAAGATPEPLIVWSIR